MMRTRANPEGKRPTSCSCPAPKEPGPNYRQRLRNHITTRMARLRGLFNQQTGAIDPSLPGAARNPYEPIKQLQTKYASRYFNAGSQQYAEQKYGRFSDNKGYGIKLKKILAAGGYGIAALVEHRRPNGERMECVMKVEKARLQLHNSHIQEEKALTKYKGAKHTVQLNDVTQEIKAQRAADSAGKKKYTTKLSYEAQDEKWDIKRQRDRPFVLIEHAVGGNLHQWLCKSSRSSGVWPQKALWLLFQCLTKGLIGMGYPPKNHYKADHPNWDPNNPIDEYIPRPEFNLEEAAHFDLDPHNVLASEDEAHGKFPIFKIADFGNVEFFDEVANDPEHFSKTLFWKCRMRGKQMYYAPEQFHHAWDTMTDFVDDNGPNLFVATDGRKPPIAGNYGMHTNIYQVGVIMWCAITKCTFTAPVVPMQYPNYQMPGLTTYGGALQHESLGHIDAKLRDLVQLCMAEDPAHRPTLDVLIKTINDRLAGPDLESDQEVMEWSTVYFSTPRVPGDEPPPGAQEEPVHAGQKHRRPDDDEDTQMPPATRQRLDDPLVRFHVVGGPAQQPNKPNEWKPLDQAMGELHDPLVRFHVVNGPGQQPNKPAQWKPLDQAMRELHGPPAVPDPDAYLEPKVAPAPETVFNALRNVQPANDVFLAQNPWPMGGSGTHQHVPGTPFRPFFEQQQQQQYQKPLMPQQQEQQQQQQQQQYQQQQYQQPVMPQQQEQQQPTMLLQQPLFPQQQQQQQMGFPPPSPSLPEYQAMQQVHAAQQQQQHPSIFDGYQTANPQNQQTFQFGQFPPNRNQFR